MTKLRIGAGVFAGLMALMLFANPVSAFHCYVADKPNGAGAVSEADIKEAGSSGNLIVPGAFIDTSETGAPNDIFIRGQSVDDPEVPPLQGIGTLPTQPHESGSETHGVQAFEFE